MAKDTDEIVVGANGTVRAAPLATTAPATSVATPAVGWLDLGYVSEDGVTIRDAKTLEPIPVWQLFHPARMVVTGREFSVSFALRQWSKNTAELAFGGTVTEPDGVTNPGEFKLTPPSPEDVDERSLMVDWVDGGSDFRLVIPRGVVTEGVESNLRRGSASDLPITFGVIGSDTGDPWYLLTNHPAFDPS